MKILLVLGTLYLGLILCEAKAQVVQDPLHDYYIRNFGKIDSTTAPDPESPSQPITPQTQIYCFQADFTGGGKKSIFITDDDNKLGPHGDYSWAVYCPVTSGGYQLLSNDSHFIDAGIKGPVYVGYIEQLKRYGAITALGGGKYGITAQYLDNGTIRSQLIDQKQDQADAKHYPKYFGVHARTYEVTTYTLGQLAQKYGK